MRWTCKYIFHMGYTVYNNVQPCHSSFETREDNLNLTLPAKRSSIIIQGARDSEKSEIWKKSH